MVTTLGAMAAVLDDVGKSKVLKKTEEEVFEDALEEDVDDGSATTKKRRKRRKKKAQGNGKFMCKTILFPFIFRT